MTTTAPPGHAVLKRLTGALAALTALATTATLASCAGGSFDTTAPDPVHPVPAAVQLVWNPNVENTATVVAQQRNYFRDEGLDVTILPGGPEVAADAQVVSGNADMAILTSEALANAVANGAPLVGIGAVYQRSPSVILTKADSGITTPKDLEGRRFGMSQTDQRVYDPFFASTGVDTSRITKVAIGADPSSLMSGEVDAMSAVAANQPVVVRENGVETREIPLADYGYNRWSGVIVVRKDALETDGSRERLFAMARAIERGAEDSVADPEACGALVYDSYARDLGLTEESQIEGAKIWADLTASVGRRTALSRIDDAGVRSQQEFFDLVGINATATDLYDTTISKEVFGND
ncbi:ABC transporter substrate-binding protein [uncultured Corynebacterium sp.]|uniref:ABC transporter substrate-binding protein n=1 Tax=uncultured Corynebacterium sp. TaxID=159447 RepID=UPI0025D50B8C|nr:ABC transporter substrate-binding protein [uncultured Corynebacterium sp.]